MRVISKKPFDEASKLYPNDKIAIQGLYRMLHSKNYVTPEDLKGQFPSLDRFKYREKWWVIDVGGNNLRLMAYIKFETQMLFVKHIVTHKEYDRLTDFYRRNKE